MTRYI
ncbi:hypothetical protein VTL71DRAFT_8209 [Oculimacula yallundae]